MYISSMACSLSSKDDFPDILIAGAERTFTAAASVGRMDAEEEEIRRRRAMMSKNSQWRVYLAVHAWMYAGNLRKGGVSVGSFKKRGREQQANGPMPDKQSNDRDK